MRGGGYPLFTLPSRATSGRKAAIVFFLFCAVLLCADVLSAKSSARADGEVEEGEPQDDGGTPHGCCGGSPVEGDVVHKGLAADPFGSYAAGQ